MTDFEVTSSLISSHSSTESRNSDEEKISHEELVEALSDVSGRMISVIQEKRNLQKSLKTTVFEKENLQQDLSKAISDIKTLEERIEEKMNKSAPQTNQQEVISKLVFENAHLKKLFENFKFSQKSLDSMLAETRRFHNLSGLGYSPQENISRSYKVSTSKNIFLITSISNILRIAIIMY